MNKFLEIGLTSNELMNNIKERIYNLYIQKLSKDERPKSLEKIAEENYSEIEKEFENRINEYFNEEFKGIKLTYLNEVYEDDSKGTKTKNTYYTIYRKHILYLEESSKKDLMNFSKDEVENIFMMSLTTSSAVKGNLWTFVNQYLTWCVSKGLVTNNVCDLLDPVQMKRVRDKVLKNKYYSKEEIYETCFNALEFKKEIVELKSGETKDVLLHSNEQGVLPLLLARYGVVGKKAEDMLSLKKEDVDVENREIRVWNTDRTEIKRVVQIDEDFIQFYDKAIRNVGLVGFVKEYAETEYVLKSTTGKAKLSGVYLYLKKMFEVREIDSVSFLDLENSCKIDILREIDLEKGYVDSWDFKSVVEMFNSEASETTYYNLRVLYEAIYPQSDVRTYKSNGVARKKKVLN